MRPRRAVTGGEGSEVRLYIDNALQLSQTLVRAAVQTRAATTRLSRQIGVVGKSGDGAQLEAIGATPIFIVRSVAGIGIDAEEHAVLIDRTIRHIDRTDGGVQSEATFAALHGGRSVYVRQYEAGSAEDIIIIRSERVILVGIARVIFAGMVLEAAPDGIIGHLVVYTLIVLMLVLIPYVRAHLQLGQGIMRQVIEPDERVVYLATVRLESDMSVVEGGGAVDDDDIIGHLRQVIIAHYGVKGLGIDSSTGIGVEEAVDNQARTATVVDTHGGRTFLQNGCAFTVIHKDTVRDGQFGQCYLFAVNQGGIGVQRHIEVRRPYTATAFVTALPAVIDGSTTLLGGQTTQVI